MDKINAVKRYLANDIDLALELARDCNSYDGSFDYVNIWDIEELCSYAYGNRDSVYELVRAIIYGEVNNICDPIRMNSYGNWESVDEFDLRYDTEHYYLNDITEKVIELYDSNDITVTDDELLEILDAEDEEEE